MNASAMDVISDDVRTTVTEYPLNNVTTADEYLTTWIDLQTTGGGQAAVRRLTPSDYVEFRIASSLILVFPFLPLVIGTLGNFLSLVVLTRPSMRQSSSCVYMTALAVFDTLAIWFGFTSQKLGYIPDVVTVWFCRSLYFLLTLVNQMAAWLVVWMSSERFVAIYFPFKASKLCTVKRARAVILLTFLFFLIFCAHEFVTVTVTPNRRFCLSDKANYGEFLKIWSYIDVAFNALIPEVSILVFNVLIVSKLRAGTRNRKEMTNAQGGDTSQQREKQVRLLEVIGGGGG